MRPIMHSLFFLLFFGALIVPLDFFIQDQPSAVVLIQGVGQALMVSLLTGVLFLPKIYLLWMSIRNAKPPPVVESFVSKDSSFTADTNIMRLKQAGVGSIDIGGGVLNSAVSVAMIPLGMRHADHAIGGGGGVGGIHGVHGSPTHYLVSPAAAKHSYSTSPNTPNSLQKHHQQPLVVQSLPHHHPQHYHPHPHPHPPPHHPHLHPHHHSPPSSSSTTSATATAVPFTFHIDPCLNTDLMSPRTLAQYRMYQQHAREFAQFIQNQQFIQQQQYQYQHHQQQQHQQQQYQQQPHHQPPQPSYAYGLTLPPSAIHLTSPPPSMAEGSDQPSPVFHPTTTPHDTTPPSNEEPNSNHSSMPMQVAIQTPPTVEDEEQQAAMPLQAQQDPMTATTATTTQTPTPSTLNMSGGGASASGTGGTSASASAVTGTVISPVQPYEIVGTRTNHRIRIHHAEP